MQEVEGISLGLFDRNNNDLEISPVMVDFIIQDSIHSLIPTINLKIQDHTGVLQEYLFSLEGQVYTLKFKDKRFSDSESYKSFKFSIDHDNRKTSLENTINVSQNFDIFGYHIFREKDTIKSKGFKDTSSNIVNRISLENGLLSSVETTNDFSIYYQNNISDNDFIKNVLLKDAYSINSQTPFFAFIDNDSCLNYKSYKKIMEDDKVSELNFNASDYQKMNRDVILNYNILSVGGDTTRKLRKRKISYVDKTGMFQDNEEDSISDFYKNVDYKKYLPIVKTQDNGITGFIYFEDYPDQKLDNNSYNRVKGRIISSMKNTLFLERIVIDTNYNPVIKSGKKIKLNFMTASQGESVIELSFYLSDDYIIENSYIIWDSKSRQLTNRFIASRKNIFVLQDISFKDKLWK